MDGNIPSINKKCNSLRRELWRNYGDVIFLDSFKRLGFMYKLRAIKSFKSKLGHKHMAY